MIKIRRKMAFFLSGSLLVIAACSKDHASETPPPPPTITAPPSTPTARDLGDFSFALTEQACNKVTCSASLRGTIATGASEVVAAVLNDISKKGLRPFVFLNSPGGDIDEAMRIGRLLRSHQSSVVAAKECNSACVLLIASGVTRSSHFAGVGIHSPFLDGAEGSSFKEYQVAHERIARDVKAYLQEMNISPELFEAMATVPSASVRALTDDEKDRFGLNSSDPAWQDFMLGKRAQRLGVTKDEYIRREQLAESECLPLLDGSSAYALCESRVIQQGSR